MYFFRVLKSKTKSPTAVTNQLSGYTVIRQSKLGMAGNTVPMYRIRKPQYPDLADLAEVMRELPDVDPALVPRDSLLREFIGGSELAY